MKKILIIIIMAISFIKVNVLASNLYLDNLYVEGYDINFNSNTYEYTLDVGYEVRNLVINAYSENKYNIVGAGRIHINEGENTILIKVTDDAGNRSDYIIKVNRVKKVSNIVNNNIDEIKEAIKSNNDLIVNLDKSDNLIVTKDILNTINKKTITYNILDNNKIIYSYIFDGNKFNTFNNDIDLTINFNETNSNKKANINDKKLIYFNTLYNGTYPDNTILKIYNKNSYHKESRLNLYKENDNSLELISKDNRINDELITFNIKDSGYYVISSKNTKLTVLYNVLIATISIIIIILILICYTLIRKRKQVSLPTIDDYIKK